jgi:hypothetical protein
MPTSKLRALFNAGLTYDEIALINERSEGWRPSRDGVKKKRERMGLPARRPSHRDLLPWTIAPEHNSNRLRHMLQAESRKRAGLSLSSKDKILVNLLHDLLFGRGSLLVVGYDRHIGFYLIGREDSDTDIIRRPSQDISIHKDQLGIDTAEPDSSVPEYDNGHAERS